MTKIFNLDQIKEALENFEPIKAIEDGFVAYSQGKVIVPPVGELIFKDPPGDMHIKYGYIIGVAIQDIQISKAVYQALGSCS